MKFTDAQLLEFAAGKIKTLEAQLDAAALAISHYERTIEIHQEVIEELDEDIAALIDDNDALRKRIADLLAPKADPGAFPMFLDPGVHSNS